MIILSLYLILELTSIGSGIGVGARLLKSKINVILCYVIYRSLHGQATAVIPAYVMGLMFYTSTLQEHMRINSIK